MPQNPEWDGRLPGNGTLRDGTTLVVRELHPGDDSALRAWFVTLSAESRYQRFHSVVGDLSPAHWRYLTRIDNDAHIAVVALDDNSIVGIARLVRIEGTEAEVSFLIDDRLHRRGVGTLLRDVVVSLATMRGYDTLYAHVLPENRGIRRLLAASGLRITDRGRVVELRLPMLGRAARP